MAYHNWGRWVADCADPYCANAEEPAPGDTTMVCSWCGQRSWLVWPDRADVDRIERLLSLRPVPSTRNWTPGETMGDLAAENIAHGLGGV